MKLIMTADETYHRDKATGIRLCIWSCDRDFTGFESLWRFTQISNDKGEKSERARRFKLGGCS
jgi:hypothetical protein